MEPGERLASPSAAPSSLNVASSSASSSPVPPQTPSTKCSPTPNPAGHLLRMTGDERLNISGSSNAFPLISRPAFGLYTSSSGRSEFGGLGSLGLSALAAHPQFGTFPDWWRPSEAQTRGAAAFFPPLLGLHPVFAPTFKSHDPIHLQSRTSVSVGMNGTVNGRSASSPTGNSAASNSSLPAKGNKEKTKANCSRSQKSSQDMGQLHQKTIQKTKEKKLNKKPLETSSMSGSHSGSLSDSSSDGEESSSDPDDMEEDEEDNDDDEDDQSNDSEDSDSEKESPVKRKVKRLTQNTCESKKKRPCTADGNTTQDSQSVLAQQHNDSVLLTSSYLFQSSSLPAGLPQSTALFLQSPRTAEEEGKQHISVIQTTRLATGNSPLAQSHREASPLPSRSSPNLISFSSSPKHLPPSTSPKHFSHSASPKHSSVSFSPKPLALCSSSRPLSLCSSPKRSSVSSPKPPSLSSLPKAPTLLASQKSPHKPKSLIPSPKHTQLVDSMKSSGTLLDESSLHMNSFKLKQAPHSKDSFKLAFSMRPKEQDWYKSHKTSASSLETSSSHLLSLPHSNDTNLFMNHHPNGAIHSSVQDAPLALIVKPRSQSSATSGKPLLAASSPHYHMPTNLSTSTKEPSGTSAAPLKSSSLLGLRPQKRKTPKSKINSSSPPVNLVRSSESDIHSSKDSDDSLGDDYNDDDEDDEDDIEDEDSGSSLSESESNLESDSDGSEDDMKECGETEADSDAERTPLKLGKSSLSTYKSASSISANCSLLNLQVIRPPSLPSSLLTPTTVTTSGTSSNHSTPSPSFTLASLPGSGKRRRVTDERILRLPLEFGWQRETQIRSVAGRLQGEVAYFAPCGKKLRQYPDVMKYLLRNGITELSRDNFSFSTKIKVGDFYEAREGPEGLQWFLLPEEEIAPSIIAMDGRRSRRTKSEHQPTGDGAGARPWKGHLLNIGEPNLQDVSDAKLLRKLEAQEIARQAAQIKMMRKLEKQAMAQAAKEAKKQQAIMAAEERRKKREQMKILKQQEKIKRIQQNRMEKELRAQQILEAKRKRKEEAANAKILEAEKRNKEKEMRRLQAVILKHQELERHRLDMERERRRQHMMLMKAVEARKKAEEKERLKKEKKDEKRLNKERKLELKRLELEKAKELKKPNEDMCLADHKPLPELSCIPGLVLPGSTFSDCLMVLQFLRSFGKVLGLDINSNLLNLSDLQEGLLNIGDSTGKVQDLLVSLLSAAVCDPGIPAGHKSKTALGDHLTNVGINRDNVSEILQIYMEGHCEQTEMAALALSLRTKAFQAHNPSQKASMLAFLVNELCCSKAVISEIDKHIDHMTNLRKDKWVVEGKLRKLRSIHAKKTGKRDISVGGEDSHASAIPTARNKCKRKEGDSEEEDDEDDESEDQGDDDDEEEEESGGKKGRKAEICEEEDNSVHSASVEELEKQIEKTYKQQSQIRQKLFNSSHSLRSMMIGQDRYKRRYWVLPQCGGIFVEGVESGEGYEEEKDKKIQMTAQVIRVKEEQLEEVKKPVVSSQAQGKDRDTATPENQQDKDSLNLFLQKPGSFSKLSKLLEISKMAQDSDMNSQNSHSAPTTTTAYYPSHPISQSATTQQGLMDKTDTSVPFLHKSTLCMIGSPQSILHDDHLSKMLTEKSNQWFSLLPRSPCDESSVTSGSSPPASSSPPQTISTKSPSSLSPNPLSTASSSTPAGIDNMQLSVLQQVKSGIHQGRLTQCDMSSAAMSPSLPFPGISLPPMLDLASQHAEGNGNRVLFLANNNSVNKSGTPEAPSDKPSCASFPAAEVAKTQDYPCPQPIPEEMLRGWWRLSDMEELRSLVKALHSRGVRERVLQKQIQKHMEYMTHLCASSKDAIDVAELEKQEVSAETVESWCVEEQAMEVDISLLQQVENLERKVISASLQVKGWMHPELQSEREDLVYHEHKPFSSSTTENRSQRETSQEELPGSVVRHPNNPLDIAVTRLAELERNIERSSSEEEVSPGMRLWHKALSEVRSSAQLSLCIQQLQKSIAWERSIMKAHCQLCQKGDNEGLLLLCDGCDKGCHTYCHKPKITTVPDGDWFCPTCVAKESGQSPRSRKQQSRTAGGGKKGSEVKQNSKPSVAGELIKEEAASSSSGVPRKGTKEFRKRKGDDSPSSTQAKHDSPVSCAKKAKTAKDNSVNELAMCRVLLAELEAHQDAWPFLTPVNLKAVPGYRKVIKRPMDFSTIREKLTNNQYLNLETFIIDVNLVFDNCEKFNEDDSAIGRAGHNMRRFFDKRWTELLK
ncbi:bromodomain adjacent to zinc finger domain protein 2B isoform X1 [Thunnus albacares]|uniref:bromodomain adjacent to zinc finger domain protein 2B isoform X1 n=1 Tax=Thunnus albacares TaxID=8236 RepID=UPI001CF6B96A|nr:bromodomain adjacent to zinc finger domain protein 2B isoform X1 [Thunnus albacares]XP_044221780.1 bromodomain adjacent to zinc finger domain protein 2B isoform X1 [Thunnus albacares]